MNSFKNLSLPVFILALGLVTCSQTTPKPSSESKAPASSGSVTSQSGPTGSTKSTKTAGRVKSPTVGKTPVPQGSSVRKKTSGMKTTVVTTKTTVKSPSQISNSSVPAIVATKIPAIGVSGSTGVTNSGTGKINSGSDVLPPQNSKSGKLGTGNTTTSPSPTAATGKTGTSASGNVLNNILGNGTGNFTESDAGSAIKEALMKGVTKAVSQVSASDGYFKNSLIKIPFPQDAKVIESTMRTMGMGSTIDNLILSLNRAAESAANQAGPIFINGIKQMTISDAMNIVSNQQPDAATKFLQRTTTESLVSAFKAPIQTALDKTLATKYWNDIMSNYNRIPFVQKINPDLNDFVTRKAITGLFYVLGQEEAKIRKDPVGQGSKIIETVFGSVLKR